MIGFVNDLPVAECNDFPAAKGNGLSVARTVDSCRLSPRPPQASNAQMRHRGNEALQIGEASGVSTHRF